VRQGHLGWFEFQSFVAQIPDDEPWLEAICTLAFTFGFRRGDLTFMKVGQVDFDRSRIILPAGSTKNKMPRSVFFNPSGAPGKLLKAMAKGKRSEHYLLWRDDGSTPVRDFRVSFDNAASSAKITTGSGGKLFFHDLRRSCVARLAGDIGLSESQSMSAVGHLSVDVHRRYKIISDNSAREIARKIDPDV